MHRRLAPPNYAFEPSVMRSHGAPRAPRIDAPAALDPVPHSAAQRER